MKSLEGLTLLEIVKAEVWRGNGGPYSVEPTESLCVNDLITSAGRTFLAQRICLDINSPMAYMAVGTVSTAAALGDTSLTGEVKRKILSTNSATANLYTAVMTIGGGADSVTSLSLVEAGIINAAASGVGTLFQRVTFTALVLANSDLVKFTLQTNVGSS